MKLDKGLKTLLVILSAVAVLFTAISIVGYVYQNNLTYLAAGYTPSSFIESLVISVTSAANPYSQASMFFGHLLPVISLIADIVMLLICLTVSRKGLWKIAIPDIIVFIFTFTSDTVIQSVIYALAGVDGASLLFDAAFRCLNVLLIVFLILGLTDRVSGWIAKTAVVVFGLMPFAFSLYSVFSGVFESLAAADYYLGEYALTYKIVTLVVYFSLYLAKAIILTIEIVCVFGCTGKIKGRNKVNYEEIETEEIPEVEIPKVEIPEEAAAE